VCGRFTSSQRREAIGERFEVAVPETYSEREWQGDVTWKNAGAKLNRTVTATNPDTGDTFTGPVMSRDNPEWIGRILIQQRDPATGVLTGYSLSSTRQTRDAAYQHLRQIAEPRLPSRTRPKKPPKAATCGAGARLRALSAVNRDKG
jgi:hypothetical protein